MKFQTKAILAAVILASATNAFAGSTAQLRVIGTVIPGACEPRFAGGNVIDYGNISQSDLSATADTPLQTHQIGFTITCDAPIVIATSWTDNRLGSATTTGQDVFGLGTQGTAGIGYYGITHGRERATADGVIVRNIFSNDNGATWNAASGVVNPLPGNLMGYGQPGTLVPVAFKDYTGVLDVTATIAPTGTLDMAAPLVLDGLSTMEVRYL